MYLFEFVFGATRMLILLIFGKFEFPFASILVSLSTVELIGQETVEVGHETVHVWFRASLGETKKVNKNTNFSRKKKKNRKREKNFQICK